MLLQQKQYLTNKMAKQRYSKKWSELTEEQKAKSGSKSEHSAKREENNLKGTSAAATARAKAQAHQTPAASPNSAALNNEHSPKANDVGVQAKPAAARTNQQKYNNTVSEWGEQYRKDNEPEPGKTWGNTHTINFGSDGKLNQDGSKQQLFNTDKLKELGYSEGDNLYRGGDDGLGRFGTGLMGQGGMEVYQGNINAHWQGGSNYDPQVARMIKSGQIKLDDNSGTWSSYDKQGKMLQSGNIDTSRERYGYTHESANAAKNDKFYDSSSNTGVKAQAQQFTQEQKVRDEGTRQAEIKRSQDPNGRPNFVGAWSNLRANEIYRETGGQYEFNPSADGQYSFDNRSAGSRQRFMDINYNFDPNRFNQGQQYFR